MRPNRRQKRNQLCHIVRVTRLAGLGRNVVVLPAKQAKMLEVAVAAIWVRPASQDLINKRSSGTDQLVIIFENPDTCHPDDNRNLRIRMPAFKPFPVVLLNGTYNVAVEKALRKRQHGYIIKNNRGLCQKIGHAAMLSVQHPLEFCVGQGIHALLNPANKLAADITGEGRFCKYMRIEQALPDFM